MTKEPRHISASIGKFIKHTALERMNQAFGADFEDPNIAEVFFLTWLEIQQSIYVSHDNRPQNE